MAKKQEENQWLSCNGFANKMGISTASVTRALRSGRIQGKRVRNKIMLNWKTQSKAYLATSTRITEAKPRKVPKNGKVVNISGLKNPTDSKASGRYGELTNARTQKEYYQAEKLRLEYETARGSLVKSDEIAKEWERITTLIKKSLLSIPDRLSPVLAGETKQNRVHRMLSEEIRHTLQALSEEVENE